MFLFLRLDAYAYFTIASLWTFNNCTYLFIIMRTIKLLILTTLSLSINKDIPSKTELDYTSFEHIIIVDINSIETNNYYLYFYTEQCFYCASIKHEILSFASKTNNFYFVNVATTYISCNGLDGNKLNTYCIYGTPTLKHFINKQLDFTLIGASKIRDYLFSNS